MTVLEWVAIASILVTIIGGMAGFIINRYEGLSERIEKMHAQIVENREELLGRIADNNVKIRAVSSDQSHLDALLTGLIKDIEVNRNKLDEIYKQVTRKRK